MEKANVEFVSYDGEWPCLCMGDLTVRVDGKDYTMGFCLSSGGSTWFDDNDDEHISKGPWTVREDELPEEIRRYKDEIEALVNEHVPQGCCGGCI